MATDEHYEAEAALDRAHAAAVAAAAARAPKPYTPNTS